MDSLIGSRYRINGTIPIPTTGKVFSINWSLTWGFSSVEDLWALSTDYESHLLRFGSRLQYGVKVLSGSLSNILKGRYLLKRRKVTIGRGVILMKFGKF